MASESQPIRQRVWEYVVEFMEEMNRPPEYVPISRDEAVSLIVDPENSFVKYNQARGFPRELLLIGPTGLVIRCVIVED